MMNPFKKDDIWNENWFQAQWNNVKCRWAAMVMTCPICGKWQLWRSWEHEPFCCEACCDDWIKAQNTGADYKPETDGNGNV